MVKRKQTRRSRAFQPLLKKSIKRLQSPFNHRNALFFEQEAYHKIKAFETVFQVQDFEQETYHKIKAFETVFQVQE